MHRERCSLAWCLSERHRIGSASMQMQGGCTSGGRLSGRSDGFIGIYSSPFDLLKHASLNGQRFALASLRVLQILAGSPFVCLYIAVYNCTDAAFPMGFFTISGSYVCTHTMKSCV